MNKKLFVGNLPFGADEAALTELFSSAGQVASARIMMDRDTGRSRGFGFVEMADEAGAQKAIETLQGADFMGRPLTVSEAREQAPRGGGGGFGGGRGPRGGGGGGFGGGGRGGDRGGRY
jgi:RNA recognition motif-containing protein